MRLVELMNTAAAERLKNIRNRYAKTIGSLKAGRAEQSTIDEAYKEVEALNIAIKALEPNMLKKTTPSPEMQKGAKSE